MTHSLGRLWQTKVKTWRNMKKNLDITKPRQYSERSSLALRFFEVPLYTFITCVRVAVLERCQCNFWERALGLRTATSAISPSFNLPFDFIFQLT